MNLDKLFDMQRVLDERIIKEKGLEWQDLLPNTILALQVELGELANEWRGFKHWSNDREPRTSVIIGYESKENEHSGLDFDPSKPIYKNKVLEEYVDCLHFILSIGIQRQLNETVVAIGDITFKQPNPNVTMQFNEVFESITDFNRSLEKNYFIEPGYYVTMVETFLSLGYALRFSKDQIEQAYMDKNKVNHERQTNGY